MKNGPDERNLVIVDDGAISGLARWAPMAVVVCVVCGFVVLSWYAYHVGAQSVKDEDLLVVEADKTPMKEKPRDPGGMKFPNQDKTIFDTFSNNSQQPLKVERVLPKPEEPMTKDVDTSDTSTWINDKLQKHTDESAAAPEKEKIIGSEANKTENVAKVSEADKAKNTSQLSDHNAVDHQVIAAEPAVDGSYVAHKPADKAPDKEADKNKEKAAPTVVADAADAEAEEDAPNKTLASTDKPEEKAAEEKPKDQPQKEEQPKAETLKAQKQENKQAAPVGSFVVQLGAYRSEQEATEAWNKMHLKQKELSDKQPVIVKADLGSKGIYFRLRVGGIASVAEAKELCTALSAKRQPCILPVGQ